MYWTDEIRILNFEPFDDVILVFSDMEKQLFLITTRKRFVQVTN